MYFLVLAILKGLRMFRAVSLLELLNSLLFTATTITAALVGWESAGAMMVCYGATLLVVLPLFALPLSHNIADDSAPVPDEVSSGEPPLPIDDSEVVEQQMLASQREAIPVELNRSPGERAPGSPDRVSPLYQLVKFSAWAAVAAVVWQVLQYYPMWFLQKTHGPAVTAVFGGVRLITQVVVIGAITIIAVIQTSVTKLWEAQGRAEADRLLTLAYKSTSLLMLIGCVLFAAAAAPVMRLFPRSFAIGVPIVPLSLMFFLISSHLMFLAIHFALIEKMRHLFWPWMLGLACNVLFGLWLVSPSVPAARALVGAAWAGTLGIAAALAAVILLMRFEKRPVDLGMTIFWAAIFLLALPLAVQLVCLLVIVGLSLATNWIFTADEKAWLRAFVRQSRDTLSGLIDGRWHQGGRA
jgi:hypothetical protein